MYNWYKRGQEDVLCHSFSSKTFFRTKMPCTKHASQGWCRGRETWPHKSLKRSGKTRSPWGHLQHVLAGTCHGDSMETTCSYNSAACLLNTADHRMRLAPRLTIFPDDDPRALSRSPRFLPHPFWASLCPNECRGRCLGHGGRDGDPVWRPSPQSSGQEQL